VKTTVREERLLVVSDVHMGNRLHRPRRTFTEFAQFALDHSYSVCINGDGVDLAQLSITQLTSDITPSLALFMRFGENGRRIYYTVGNHDIALEHFLSDTKLMKVVPFLNVYSGDKRIRVEHGHTYDSMFLKFPALYSLFTAIGRLAIGIHPRVYAGLHHFNLEWVSFVEWVLSGFKTAKTRQAETASPEGGVPGQREVFQVGAENVGMRGFDAVMFGHTHIGGATKLLDGILYFNTGGWFTTPYCVAIDHGRIWFGTLAQLVNGPDPFPLSESAYPAPALSRRPAHTGMAPAATG
jgi:UDP-2,3-diacylglucosamine pyrophosphatase LpxH